MQLDFQLGGIRSARRAGAWQPLGVLSEDEDCTVRMGEGEAAAGSAGAGAVRSSEGAGGSSAWQGAWRGLGHAGWGCAGERGRGKACGGAEGWAGADLAQQL